MIVAHNLNALSTTRNLNFNNTSMAKSLRNLSSGYKINSGSDDPSGLVISEQLRAQTAGLKRAVQNTQEAQNVLGIAEGALNEMNNILKKMKQLAVHSANNGVTSPEQIAADQAEVDSSVQTIDRIARTTKFSDQKLLDGNKALRFSSSTVVDSTADFPLIDEGLSEFYQIGSYDQAVSISFNGQDQGGDALMTTQAEKAYFELDGADSRLEIETNAEGVTVLSKDQNFTLTGENGSRVFSFAAGTALGEMVDSINSASGSVGAEAALIFNSDQTVNMIAYTTTSIINDFGTVQTDGGGGSIPVFDSVAGVGLNGIVANPANRVTNFDINAATTAVDGQVEFTLVDNLTNVKDTVLVNLAALGATGTSTVGISLDSFAGVGGTTINFNYTYGYDTAGTGSFGIATGNLIDLASNNVVTNNAVTVPVGAWGGGGNAVPGILTSTVDTNRDVYGNSWYVDVTAIAGEDVTFRLHDNTNNLVDVSTETMSTLGNIGTGTINVALNAGGTTVDFDWSFENDPKHNVTGAWDTIGTGNIIRFDGAGNSTFVTGAVTNGRAPTALDVTAPSDPVNAAQNMTAQVDIFDVVNGETPLTVSVAEGTAANEVVFTISGSSTDPLMTQTVTLNPFNTARTNYQTISLETPNGSVIGFDYYYENDPSLGVFDRPVGDLFSVDATPVNSERLFNGLTSAAETAGASVDINLDPSTGTHLQNLEYGRNTDGQGRIFIKVVEHDTATQQLKFELYKNADMSPSALIGWGEGSSDGTTAISISASNNSNIEGEITFDDNGGTVNFMDERNFGQDAYVAVGGVWSTNGVDYSGSFESNLNSEAGAFNFEETVFSGVELGENTDNLGQIYFRTVQDGANSGQVFAYSDKRMRDEDLVAMTEESQDLQADQELILNSVNGSGLGIITRTGSVDWGGVDGTTYTGLAQFTQLGIRLSASEYGSSQELTLTQDMGQCWEYYNSEGDSVVVTETDGAVRLSGQDAVVNINGEERTCDGLTLELATLEMSGKLVFNQGEVGATTVAQVGYSDGSLFTNAGFLTDDGDGWTDTNSDGSRDTDEIITFKAGANLVNAGHDTTVVFDSWSGGMQLQLGDGAGAENRTVLGVSSATAFDLGKVKVGDKLLRLNDLLAGGAAALGTDPISAMKIIDQAIKDVSDLRARIGAWQSNLLETNTNSLNVAIENITKTESYIRDADMANESTDFSKNQIMVQAGTSMLAQANSLQQGVLSLLG